MTENYIIPDMIKHFSRLTHIDYSECDNRARKLRECGFLPSGRVGSDAIPITLEDLAKYFLSFGSSSIAKSPEAVMRLSQLLPVKDSNIELLGITDTLLKTLTDFLHKERFSKLRRIELSRIFPIALLVFQTEKEGETCVKFSEACDGELYAKNATGGMYDIRFSLHAGIIHQMKINFTGVNKPITFKGSDLSEDIISEQRDPKKIRVRMLATSAGSNHPPRLSGRMYNLDESEAKPYIDGGYAEEI